jgi:hypothetical protein
VKKQTVVSKVFIWLVVRSGICRKKSMWVNVIGLLLLCCFLSDVQSGGAAKRRNSCQLRLPILCRVSRILSKVVPKVLTALSSISLYQLYYICFFRFPFTPLTLLPKGTNIGRTNVRSVAVRRMVDLKGFLQSLFQLTNEVAHVRFSSHLLVNIIIRAFIFSVTWSTRCFTLFSETRPLKVKEARMFPVSRFIDSYLSKVGPPWCILCSLVALPYSEELCRLQAARFATNYSKTRISAHILHAPSFCPMFCIWSEPG